VRHQHAVQLRWSDPDVYGHVNHARALSLVEDARLTMASETAAGGDGSAHPPVILARLEVDYLRQLYYRPHEQVTIESWVTRLAPVRSPPARSCARTGTSRCPSSPSW